VAIDGGIGGSRVHRGGVIATAMGHSNHRSHHRYDQKRFSHREFSAAFPIGFLCRPESKFSRTVLHQLELFCSRYDARKTGRSGGPSPHWLRARASRPQFGAIGVQRSPIGPSVADRGRGGLVRSRQNPSSSGPGDRSQSHRRDANYAKHGKSQGSCCQKKETRRPSCRPATDERQRNNDPPMSRAVVRRGSNDVRSRRVSTFRRLQSGSALGLSQGGVRVVGRSGEGS
jgi:hypothetical protein